MSWHCGSRPVSKELRLWNVLFLVLMIFASSAVNAHATGQQKEQAKYKGAGTTSNLRNIVIGRCYHYMSLDPDIGLQTYACLVDTTVLSLRNEPSTSAAQSSQGATAMKDVYEDRTLFKRVCFWPVEKIPVLIRIYAHVTKAEDFHRFLEKDSRVDKNCSSIWQELVDAVQRKDQCKITQEDYKGLALVAAQTIPCHKALLWSRTNDLVHRYTKATADFITLEDTFLGFLFNGLIWCGKTLRPGMNFKSCPAWNECEQNSISSFWRMASAAFARASCGTVNVMLNGSADGDIARKESFFRSVEIPNMDPSRVSEVKVWVIDDIHGEDKNSCNTKSLLELKHYIEGHKLKYSCIDNYRPVQALQCASNPDYAACNQCPLPVN